MFRVRRAEDRGSFDHGWLKTAHTFSFADYQDPEHEQFRVLRVMNEDFVGPGQGFGMHGHRDMEIVTVVLEGALQHRDSLGNGSILRPGELQRMSAGRGIRHSEFNPSETEAVHLYQIWLLPERAGLEPSWEQKAFEWREQTDRLHLVASQDGRENSLLIHQNAQVYLGRLSSGKRIVHTLEPGRHAWLQVLRGAAEAGGQALKAGDGLAVSTEREVRIDASAEAELLLFDLP